MDHKVQMMAGPEQLSISVRARLKEPECGDLLMGVRVYRGRGENEWWHFPRYRVVAIHMNGELMFLETLMENGKAVSKNTFTAMSLNSENWLPYA